MSKSASRAVRATSPWPWLVSFVLVGLFVHVPFSGEWPAPDSFRLRVAERPGSFDSGTATWKYQNADDPPEWDPAKRLLTVYLGKGDDLEVPYSTRAAAAGLDKLGVVAWLRELGSTNVESQIDLGCHWMISPARKTRRSGNFRRVW